MFYRRAAAAILDDWNALQVQLEKATDLELQEAIVMRSAEHRHAYDAVCRSAKVANADVPPPFPD